MWSFSPPIAELASGPTSAISPRSLSLCPPFLTPHISLSSCRQVLPVRRAVPPPALPLRRQALRVLPVREEVRPQRPPVQTHQGPPQLQAQQDNQSHRLSRLWLTFDPRHVLHAPTRGLALTEWGGGGVPVPVPVPVRVRVFLRTFGAFTSRTFRRILRAGGFFPPYPPPPCLSFAVPFRSARCRLSSHLRKNQLKVDFLAFAYTHTHTLLPSS